MLPLLLVLASAPMVRPGGVVQLSVLPSSILANAQSVRITGGDVGAALAQHLGDAGLRVGHGGGDGVLTVDVAMYDPPGLIGGGRTARMAVSYAYRPVEGGVTTRWTAECVGTAAFDLQTPAQRARKAVQRCLDQLGRDLAAKLAGNDGVVQVE